MKLRIATRRSNLALVQTRWVAEQLRSHFTGLAVEEVHVRTEGDRIQDRPLAAVGGKGLFVSEVEAVVVRGEADLAVHSLKDVPGDVPLAEGMGILSVPVREDPRDVLVTVDGTDLASLKRGAKVGTTSRRRVVQLQRQRPDLGFVPLRGNIETRMRKLREGQCDAIVLAAAGLARTGVLDETPHFVLPPDICLPAVGQGALAIEGALANETLRRQLKTIEDPTTRIQITAERAMLQKLEGNCHSSIAGHASAAEGRLKLDAMVASYDGDQMLRDCQNNPSEPRSLKPQRGKSMQSEALGVLYLVLFLQNLLLIALFAGSFGFEKCLGVGLYIRKRNATQNRNGIPNPCPLLYPINPIDFQRFAHIVVCLISY